MARGKESFLQSILYLMSSQIIIKILGMVYSLYLTNKKGFGDEGNAICMAGFQVYALFLGICAIGVPNVVSKMISEAIEIGDTRNTSKILKLSLTFFSLISFLFCLIIYFSSDFISKNILGLSSSGDILKILAPSIFFSTIESVFRGYFNGIRKVSISAKSTLIEQLLKTIFTIIIVEYIGKVTDFDVEWMANGAMIAVSLATISSFIYSFIMYKKVNTFKLNYSFKYRKSKDILIELFKILIPISLTTTILLFGNNIDSVTIIKILKNKLGEKEARKIYGIIISKVYLLVGLPQSLNGAVSISLIPEISRNLISKNDFKLKRNIKFSILITLLISIPSMIIMMFFPNFVFKILYPNAPRGEELLRLASISIIFTCLTQNISGILQGIGDSKTHLFAVIFGMIVKLILNYLLISNDNFLEKGAVISTVISNIVIFIIMNRKFKIKFGLNFKKGYSKPFEISKKIKKYENVKNL